MFSLLGEDCFSSIPNGDTEESLMNTIVGVVNGG